MWLALTTLSYGRSTALDIVLWNFHLVRILVDSEILPACINCEMVSFFEFLFYGFIVGTIGYALIFAAGFFLYQRIRNKQLN